MAILRVVCTEIKRILSLKDGVEETDSIKTIYFFDLKIYQYNSYGEVKWENPSSKKPGFNKDN
jgi:hypothetical protein